MSTNRFHSTSMLRWLRYAHALFGGTLSLFIAYIIVSTYILTLFRVDGQSMSPTLHDQQHIPVFLAAYWAQPPQKNDVVIIEYEGERHVRFVKRLGGVPGDTVSYQGQSITLGPNQYFALGDNPPHSTDSRTYGPIKRSQILGKVIGY